MMPILYITTRIVSLQSDSGISKIFIVKIKLILFFKINHKKYKRYEIFPKNYNEEKK